MRKRADLLLVERGLFASRARAQEAIAAGLVVADGEPVRKASQTLRADAQLDARAAHPWASRGGVKLAAALDGFGLDPEGLACLDIGAYGDYYRWLRPLAASLDIWLTEYIHPLDGVEAIVDWFRGSALRPFLAPLSDAERETFLRRYRRDLAESYQEEEDGKVLFIYPRLFMLARKAD